MRFAVIAFSCLLATAGCKDEDKDNKDSEPKDQTAKVSDAAPAPADAGQGTTGRHRDQDDWVPAEFKKGRGKWKDVGVYVDGKPYAFMKFAELPQTIMPFWAGDDQPGDPATQRYRIMDYLEGVGVPTRKIKQIQIYSGGPFVMRISGKDARKHRKGLAFRMGQGVSGKALMHVPPGLDAGTLFDKLGTMTVYIKKKPPKINKDQIPMMDGKAFYKVPYHGDPLRGGVRIYKNDRMAMHLKRNELEASEDIATRSEDGEELHYQLEPFLAKYGVELDDVVVAEVIRDDQRFETLKPDDLKKATFTALPRSSGQILLNGKIRVQALAMYDKKHWAKVQAAREKRNKLYKKVENDKRGPKVNTDGDDKAATK